jgi:hypothetical protein
MRTCKYFIPRKKGWGEGKGGYSREGNKRSQNNVKAQ